MELAMNDILNIFNRVEEFSSKHTFTHEKNVANIMHKLAIELSLPEKMANLMQLGAQVHDVGKIGIPDAILFNVHRLNDGEFRIMQQHAQIGYDLIRPFLDSDEDSLVISNIVLHHHEAYDGSGYPFGLKGEEIPLEARMAAVCDIYDALREERPYRHGLNHEQTINLMCEFDTCNKMDPRILSAFLALDIH